MFEKKKWWNKCHIYYNISNYTIDIYPAANCSIYNKTYQCHGLYTEVNYKVAIQTFNYHINGIINDVFYIHPQGRVYKLINYIVVSLNLNFEFYYDSLWYFFDSCV